MMRRVITIGLSIVLIMLSLIVLDFPMKIIDDVDAGTTIYEGVIITDTVWTISGSPYYIEGNVTVDYGVTLTIEPGVEVRFNGFYKIDIYENFIAVGTETDRITFTSNLTLPNPGDWNSIYAYTSEHFEIKYCDIDYAYYAISLKRTSGAEITNNNLLDYLNLGIELDESDNNNIASNTIESIGLGVSIFDSEYNVIEKNIFDTDGHSILLQISHHQIISNNSMNNTDDSVIELYKSSFNNVTGNYVSGGYGGISLHESEGNTLAENIVCLTTLDGIFIYESLETVIKNNTVYQNPQCGISLLRSPNCTIDSNYVYSNNDYGIRLYMSNDSSVINNNATDSYSGIYFDQNSKSEVTHNNVSDNLYGFRLEESLNNTYLNNDVYSNTQGFQVISSNNNSFIKNNVSANDNGFYLTASSNNLIHHNNIINELNQAFDDRDDNYWDNGIEGNYWNDYTGDDLNGDGIGDTPYIIDFNSEDRYPLMDPVLDAGDIQVETTPLKIISGPTAISISDITATIGWETDEISDSVVEYGPTTSYGYQVVNSSFVLTHSVELTGLTPSTVYHYRVRSKDPSDNEVVSEDNSFITESLPKSVHNLDKDTYYDAIQEAINDANSGNTIFVRNGTYYENVEVDKTLTLIGENKDTTIIDGGDNGDVVTIYSDFVNVTGFTMMNSSYLHAGISIIYSDYNNITGNTFYNNEYGLYLDSSTGNNISGNAALDNWAGIFLHYSSENRIIENDFSDNWYTIFLYQSDWNEIIHNTVSDDPKGISIGSSDWNIISNNTLSSGRLGGISLGYSIGNELTGNTMSETGIFIEGNNLEHWNTHNIPTSNTVNGEPVYYWKDQSGGILPSGAGQIILANCNNIIIENQELIHSFVGIELGFSSNISILGNNLSSNSDYGLYIFESHNNNITDNFISDNWHGIFLRKSNGNNINENIIFNNHLGIYLYHSIENNIFQNNISSNNNRGIAVKDYSSDNRIYHNIIQDNYIQAEDNGDGNYWDNGYPSGGNYWGNFTCVDEYCGPDQDQPGSDGIGDMPYVIDSDSQDDYPLLEPWEPDYIPPDINLIWPLNNSIIKPRTLINLSISDPHIYQVTYSINSGPEQPLAPPYDINTTGWTDANYILEIHAIDTHNNANTKWFNITIDSTPPSITLNSPNNNSYIIWNVEINLTISDDNLDQVSYIKDNNSVQFLSFPYNIDTDSWEDGRHVIEVTTEDLAGNLRKEQFAFTKDTTPPVITLNSPENNTFITEDVEIYFTITDENLDEVYYRINNDTYLVLPFPYRIYTKGWQDGRYVIDIIAVDFAGIGDIDQYVFTKDTKWPEITLNSPENNSLLMQASTLDFDISDVNLDSVTYSINQGTFQTLDEPYDLDTSDWDDNEYIVAIRAGDDAGHINEKWFIFRIDTSEPFIESASIYDGATKVSVDDQIVIEFSEPMECESVESAISIDPYIEYTYIWSNNNKTLTIDFSESLEYDTIYQITINTNAEDMAGRELEDKFELEFTTEPKPTDKGEEGLPLMYLLLSLIAVIIAVLLIMFMVLSKKRKTTAEVVEPEIESPVPIQVACPTCNNLLQVNDIGTTMNVSCPFCSTLLTVQSQKTPAQKPEPQIQPQPETQPKIQPQQPMMQISCPKCYHIFSVVKTDGPIKVQCPKCGVKGTMG